MKNIKGEKTIHLDYPIDGREVAIISFVSDNIVYKTKSPFTSKYNGNEIKLDGSYISRDLFTLLLGDKERIKAAANASNMIAEKKLIGVRELNFSLDAIDNTKNLLDGKVFNSLLTFYKINSSEDVTFYDAEWPQYKQLKNGPITSLTVRVTDQDGAVLKDPCGIALTLHIR